MSVTEELEIRLLLQAILARYGFDFTDYAYASIRRRILKQVKDEGLETISGLQEKVLHDPNCIERFLLGQTIHVTSMFRDPGFYWALRKKVVPMLFTYPFIRIWIAGCSTGEELYSIAILLSEEKLYDRCRIYATDMNEVVLDRAETGIFPLSAMKKYTRNYQKAGGRGAFSDYYSAQYDNARFRPALRENVVFAQHNLATDGPFNEFNLILCRNVMIYFNKDLQARAHQLYYDSLCRFGVLGLGNRETIQFTPYEEGYESLDATQKLYRKIG